MSYLKGRGKKINMKLKDLTSFLDSAIPLSFQEGYDNAGLQVGSPDKEISSALITLDVTEEVLDEAGYAGCDVIISHHPLIFTGIKQLTGKNYHGKDPLKGYQAGCRNLFSPYQSRCSRERSQQKNG